MFGCAVAPRAPSENPLKRHHRLAAVDGKPVGTATHVELGVTAVVAAGSDVEARARPWREWYGRAPRDELEALTREACEAENCKRCELPTLTSA